MFQDSAIGMDAKVAVMFSDSHTILVKLRMAIAYCVDH
jgi:hypothetical protein